MFLLRDIGPDMKALKVIAEKSPQGLAKDRLAPGQIVMISPNKGTGDRSWTTEIWSVVGTTGPYVALKGIGARRARETPVIVNAIEHEFYDAQELAQAIAAEATS